MGQKKINKSNDALGQRKSKEQNQKQKINNNFGNKYNDRPNHPAT